MDLTADSISVRRRFDLALAPPVIFLSFTLSEHRPFSQSKPFRALRLMNPAQPLHFRKRLTLPTVVNPYHYIFTMICAMRKKLYLLNHAGAIFNGSLTN